MFSSLWKKRDKSDALAPEMFELVEFMNNPDCLKQCGASFQEITNSVERLTSRKPMKFEEWVQPNKHWFLPAPN